MDKPEIPSQDLFKRKTRFLDGMVSVITKKTFSIVVKMSPISAERKPAGSGGLI